ncbi:hypothetical protein CANTEDRAFT_109764 [Yamadazyma tenuis ATCC 10573]|uniref:Aminopeptidase n=2 Tax=Candida tenuis TaxID=2315449 RepID=G3BAI6_CANTC|nr:uncharacterized protein CANTEDRAFT_109764 [Yamadazyma tenuis ATCC 10573]EGV61410.1 hypothetical protein CANTEDRAFT_109764 [Yamadazyma tenuis ATCC 10573]
MAGFYRSSYVEDGETKYLATTQFEPIDCRRAFPSFDEPALKATFDISLIAKKSLTCLSNMDVKDTILLGDDKKKVVFNTTPVMSTYLVAFIVGELNYVENNDYRVPIRVYSTSGSEKLGVYSAEISAKTLAFFDKKFDIPYPLPKCDLVAIHDFAAGAMENYGLITFRTVEVLIDPKVADVNGLKRVTEVVMHELAHQWFGNLVTMDFWDGLWLNEGFATWMSWYACDALYPDWKVWQSYVTDDLQQALSLDGLRSSHPIEVPLKRANDVNQIFDSISYAKGSSLLKMISNWLGEETFVKGVSNYLKKHKWGNTKTRDLWESLSDVSGKDVNTIMDIWTKNVGYPLVTVKELGNNEIEVTQNRFLTTGDVKEEEDQLIYPVFLTIKTSKGVDTSAVLDVRTKKFKLDTDDDFFKINADQACIYRTVYESDRWIKLGKAGIEGKLSVEDKAGLVADAASLSTSGFLSTSSLLNLTQSWANETNDVVWSELTSNIGSIKEAFKFEGAEFTEALQSFSIDLVHQKLTELGHEFSDSDSFGEQRLKKLLFGTAVSSNHPKYVQICKDLFEKFVGGDKSVLNSNIRGIVFNCAAKTGDEATFEKLFDIYQNPSSAEEKVSALIALGAFRDEKILDKVLDLLFQFDVVKKQDTYKPMISMRTNTIGVEKLWAWYTTNYEKLIEAHPPQLSMFGTLTKLSVAGFAKKEQKEKVVAFFEGKDLAYFDKSLAQALDVVTSKISWVERDSDSILSWLSTNGYTKSKL